MTTTQQRKAPDMASIEDLTIGTLVRVARRGGATGIIDAPASVDNTGTAPRPVASIRFDSKRASWGGNYPEDIEIVRPASAEETEGILRRARELTLLCGDSSKGRSQAVREFARSLAR